MYIEIISTLLYTPIHCIISIVHSKKLNILNITYLNKWIIKQIGNTMENEVKVLQENIMVWVFT